MLLFSACSPSASDHGSIRRRSVRSRAIGGRSVRRRAVGGRQRSGVHRARHRRRHQAHAVDPGRDGSPRAAAGRGLQHAHKNQIELTVTPTDDYQAKVGAAAGANGLPDLFSADVVFMPNWTSQGLFQDITEQDRRPALRGQDRAGAHRGVDLGRQAVRPAVHRRPVGVDVQQGLYRQAGLDPRSRRRPSRSSRTRPAPSPSSAVTSTARSSAATAAAASVHLVADRLGRRRAGDERGRHRVVLNSDENKEIYATFQCLVDDGTV